MDATNAKRYVLAPKWNTMPVHMRLTALKQAHTAPMEQNLDPASFRIGLHGQNLWDAQVFAQGLATLFARTAVVEPLVRDHSMTPPIVMELALARLPQRTANLVHGVHGPFATPM